MRGRTLAFVLMLGGTGPAAAVPLADHPPLQELVATLVQEDGFEREALEHLFAQAEFKQSIIDAITRPAEKMPWSRYRPIFLTEQRIDGGVAFWRQHADLLDRAQAEHGVPAEVITAIIGVETRYGAVTGSYRALDALTTLAVAGMSRSAFFGRELRHLLLLGREERIDPVTVTGSYAGALGLPQFIPSSYRAYAVDFDQDGHRDLLHSTADAIGSVANYLRRHGWQRGQPISVPATVTAEAAGLADAGLKPALTLQELRARGVSAGHAADGATLKAAVIRLEGDQGDEYHLGFDNFYAITRYNHSALYAMAVTQLAAAIGERKSAAR
ncbi:MAG TPA: lytic murein transglycosylase B [Gammaproteobacteria bacterium]|uniref:lytic murein transglycosylase B n=1 Tax=Immundisolibacter sp. TaxID=1934948 RepID=UPI000E8C1C87|nr:lytic murein transglycosylase B [Gammaproteobacteria bacterium]HCZ47513.1 lytic murein transglycosylase B [Gammaproteobacteria bacterium]MCH76951.1 lytic murein transglycosylase B [Gammaproteobacteria bacterium]